MNDNPKVKELISTRKAIIIISIYSLIILSIIIISLNKIGIKEIIMPNKKIWLVLPIWGISYIFFIMVWRHIFCQHDIKLNITKYFRYHTIEHAFFLLPFKLNYSLIPLLLKKEMNKKFIKTIPSKIIVILIEFIAAVIWAFLYFSTYFKSKIISYFILLAGIIVAMILIRSEKIKDLLTKTIEWKFSKLKGIGDTIKEGMENIRYLIKPGIISKSLIFALLAWAFEGVILHIIITSFGFNTNLILTISMHTFSTLIGVFSSIPGGIGAAEGSLGYLLFLSGVTWQYSILIAFMHRFIVAILPAIIGIMMMISGKQKLSCTIKDFKE